MSKKAEDILREEPGLEIITPYQGYPEYQRVILRGSESDPTVIKQKRWDVAFMVDALNHSLLSHCTRHKVGCLIVKDRRPVAVGINGTAPGKQNCDEIFTAPAKKPGPEYENYLKTHGEFSRLHEQHAEANAISWAARKGIEIEGAFIYVTLSPCLPCAKQIMAAGIARCYYLERYDRDPEGLFYLQNNGVEVVHMGLKNIIEHINRATHRLEEMVNQTPDPSVF